MRSVEIPGKVLLSGEYAVLCGGTAVVAPLPRFLRVAPAGPGVPGDRSPVVQAAREIPIPGVPIAPLSHTQQITGKNKVIVR